MKIFRAVLLSAACLALAACATHVNMVQSVNFRNVGAGDVYDFLLEYGSIKMPSPRGDDVFVAGSERTRVTGGSFPEQAIVHWTGPDRITHTQSFAVSARAKQVGFTQVREVVFLVDGSSATGFLELKDGQMVPLR